MLSIADGYLFFKPDPKYHRRFSITHIEETMRNNGNPDATTGNMLGSTPYRRLDVSGVSNAFSLWRTIARNRRELGITEPIYVDRRVHRGVSGAMTYLKSLGAK
ncbi:hypothetical protein ACFLQN_00640 [Candidatus Aenigmatarchaeota archaeon]